MQVRKTRVKADPSSCPKCESDAIDAYSYSDTLDFRHLELDVEQLERCKCNSCGTHWETPAQSIRNQTRIKEEYARVRDRVRERDGLLPGSRICEIRKQLSINQKEASALFGGGINSFNKYESGEVLQSFAMDRLVRLTGAIGQSAVDFLREVDAKNPLLAESSNFSAILYTIALSSTSSLQESDEDALDEFFQSSSAKRKVQESQTESQWKLQLH